MARAGMFKGIIENWPCNCYLQNSNISSVLDLCVFPGSCPSFFLIPRVHVKLEKSVGKDCSGFFLKERLPCVKSCSEPAICCTGRAKLFVENQFVNV